MCISCAVLRLKQGRASLLWFAVVIPPPAVVDPIRNLPKCERSIVLAAETSGNDWIDDAQSNHDYESNHNEPLPTARAPLPSSNVRRKSPYRVVDSPDSAHGIRLDGCVPVRRDKVPPCGTKRAPRTVS